MALPVLNHFVVLLGALVGHHGFQLFAPFVEMIGGDFGLRVQPRQELLVEIGVEMPRSF